MLKKSGWANMQNQALLPKVDPVYERLLRWLEAAAKASTKRVVTHTEELRDGRYIVCEEWPSQGAYLELVRHRMTLEAMLYTSLSSEAED
jgi:hypothetical protein